jgi:hypothetical protein
MERLFFHNQIPNTILAPLHQNPSIMEANPNEMYLSFLETGKFSDFIIECQGVEFKVHRIVVSTQSAMLEAACSGSFEARLNLLLGFNEFL